MSIRIWFLIQQFVARHDLPESNHIPFVNYFHCRRCRARVAYLETERIHTVNGLVHARVSLRLCNVAVAEDERCHRVIDALTQAETYCVQCRNLFGWTIIAVSEPSLSHRVGTFYMYGDEFISWNNVTLHDFVYGGNNEQAPNDQNGGANEQNADQDGEQDLDTNEQNADQDEERHLGTNEQSADQDEEQDLSTNGQSAGQDEEQDLSTNGQSAGQDEEQDLGTNGQSADQDEGQDLGTHGQSADQDEEQDLGTNEQNADQDGEANEQDYGPNEQNADQDYGGINEQVPKQDVDIAEGMGNIDLNVNI